MSRLPLSRFTISRRCCILKFVFPTRTSSRHAAIPPPRDEGAFRLLSSDLRPEFIRRGGTSEKGHRSPSSTSYFLISNFTVNERRAFMLLELLVAIVLLALLM